MAIAIKRGFFYKESSLFQIDKILCRSRSFLIFRGASTRFLINWFVIEKKTWISKKNMMDFLIKASSTSMIQIENPWWKFCRTSYRNKQFWFFICEKQFFKDTLTLFNVLVTLCTCAGTHHTRCCTTH